jgi:S1-C subfamily serine protease
MSPSPLFQQAKSTLCHAASCLVAWAAFSMVAQVVYAQASTAPAVYKRMAPSVVMVRAQTAEGIRQGSGVVIGAGHIVTNFHVVKGATGLIVVRQGDRIWRAEVDGSDESRDLATLSVLLGRGERFNLPVAKKRRLASLSIGERVFAIGAPRGLEQSLTDGIVSGIVDLHGGNLVQTNAAISPGSSGGGLFDGRGLLVGVTTKYIGESQGLNFAVPADDVERLRSQPPNTYLETYSDAVQSIPNGAPHAETGRPAAPQCPPSPELPLQLNTVSAVVVVASSSGPIATAGNVTDAWVRDQVMARLRNRGVWAFASREEAAAAGKLALVLSVSVNSMNIKDTVLYPWMISLRIYDHTTFVGGGSGTVSLWSDSTFGFGGSAVVVDQVIGSINADVDKLSAELKTD